MAPQNTIPDHVANIDIPGHRNTYPHRVCIAVMRDAYRFRVSVGQHVLVCHCGGGVNPVLAYRQPSKPDTCLRQI